MSESAEVFLRKQTLIKQTHQPVWQLLRSQAIVLLSTVVLAMVFGKGMAAIALLGGGLAWLLPSMLHAIIFMKIIWPSQVRQTMKRFFLAELVRIGLSGFITAFLLITWPGYALWLLAGLGLTALAVVFSPLLSKIGL